MVQGRAQRVAAGALQGHVAPLTSWLRFGQCGVCGHKLGMMIYIALVLVVWTGSYTQILQLQAQTAAQLLPATPCYTVLQVTAEKASPSHF